MTELSKNQSVKALYNTNYQNLACIYRPPVHFYRDETYLATKEILAYKKSKELREQGVINLRYLPFEEAYNKEIEGLIEIRVFELIDSILKNIYLFSTYFVDKIKYNKDSHLYKKSRLIVQAYNDLGKKEVLTQSLMI